MIAVSVSDLMEEDDIRKRVADIEEAEYNFSVPDCICIRNDSFSEEPFVSVAKLVRGIWKKSIILESEEPEVILKAVESIDVTFVTIKGANRNNLERYAEIASAFDTELCISEEDPEVLVDLGLRAKEMGVQEILLDPMVKNMKQCLETYTYLKRVLNLLGTEFIFPAIRTWSGEYALSMASVAFLSSDDVAVITDDLDRDCCDVLSTLLDTLRY